MRWAEAAEPDFLNNQPRRLRQRHRSVANAGTRQRVFMKNPYQAHESNTSRMKSMAMLPGFLGSAIMAIATW